MDSLSKLEQQLEKETIEEEARRIISGARREAYGSAKESFNNIGTVWSGILRARLKNQNITIDGETCALMLAAFKLVRESNKQGRDNRVDAIGYILLEDQIISD